MSFEDTFDSLDGALEAVEAALSPFCPGDKEDQSFDTLTAQLVPLEGARLNVGMCYAIASLYYVYLKTKGISPLDHPVKQELDRVKSYMAKIKDTEARIRGPGMKLDVSAANRFIDSALSKDQHYIKAKAEDNHSRKRKSAHPNRGAKSKR